MGLANAPTHEAPLSADVTVVIVAHRSREDLDRCLPSLAAQTVRPARVLVVDNDPASGDGAHLARHHPWVEVIASEVNGGYAGGNNLGLARSASEWVLFLNPDTELREDALEALLRAGERQPRALSTPKLLCEDGTINACGLEVHATGITACRAYGRPSHEVTRTHRVDALSGAAIFGRREVLAGLGGFDASYFMYMEDLDLSWRARMTGLELLCVADAVVTHDWLPAMTATKFGLLERNRVATLVKLLQGRTLARLAPALVLTELATWTFAVMKGPAFVRAKGRGYARLWRSRGRLLRERRAFAALRTVPDARAVPLSAARLPMSHIVRSPRLARALTPIAASLYGVLLPRRPRRSS